MATILLLEDDEDLASLMLNHLSNEDIDVQVCGNGAEGLKLALQNSYDLLILDLGLPELDGLDVCRKFRQQNEVTPILMLTARDSEIDRVIGLEMGADDYLGKPFSIRELQARVKAILRRQSLFAQASDQASNSNVLNFNELIIDPGRHEVFCRDSKIELTSKEFQLLYFLAQNAGRVYNREQLLDQIWGYTSSIYEHTVNSNINRLRNKIEQDSSSPQYIMTVRGVGYKFNDSSTEVEAERESQHA